MNYVEVKNAKAFISSINSGSDDSFEKEYENRNIGFEMHFGNACKYLMSTNDGEDKVINRACCRHMKLCYTPPPFYKQTWFYAVCGGVGLLLIVVLVGIGFYFYRKRKAGK